MTAVSWDEDDWDNDPDPAPAVPAYYCEDPCCHPRRGLLARLLTALRRRLPA